MELTFASILIRASVMYLYALVVIRLSGKQSIGQLSSMDFVVATILGDCFDSVIYSEVTIAEGLVAFGTLAIVHFLVSYASTRSLFVFRLFNSPPRMLVQNGTLLKEGLQNEWMNVETIEAEMRLKGEDQLEEVREARLETEGQLSILKNDPSKPVQKQDAQLLR